jgi:predicted DNA-binding WGR domain protein
MVTASCSLPHRQLKRTRHEADQKMAVMANQADALHQLKSIEALRRKRGYRSVV